MRASRLLATALAVGLSAAALSGCSATIVDRGAEASPGSSSPSPRETEPVERTTAAPVESAPADSTGFSSAVAADRQRMIALASATTACPSSALVEDGAVIRVEGVCPDLVIELDAGVVIADDVTNLTLSGSGTVVYVDSVEKIVATGDASAVYWAGDTPAVDDRGAANTLTHG